MSQKVVEGRAELNIQPFLDALETLQQRTAASINDISALFTQLDQTTAGSLGSIRGALRAAAQDITTIGKALAAANRLAAGGGAQQSPQQQAALTAQQRTLAALRQAQKAGFDEELAMARRTAAERVALTQSMMREITNNIRFSNQENLRLTIQRVAQERAVIERGLREQQALEQQALAQRRTASERLTQATAAKDPRGAADAQRDYTQATQAARLAVEAQKGFQKELTAVTQAEAALQRAALVQTHQAVKEAAHQAALAGKQGIRDQVTALQTELKRVEDSWNSIFRAGTQLASLGGQMSSLARQVAEIGVAATQTAGDFDFWIARTKAAMEAASSNEAVTTIDQLRSRTLELGRSLGSLEPAELAEGWFTYQAALGETINTMGDLETAQASIETMLQASIVSNSSASSVMRGVAGVLSAYRMETDDAAYATSVLMNVTQLTQAEFADLLESYKMIGSQGPVMNANLAETSTLLAMMAQQNIKGSQAGRSLNMVYSRLNDMTREGAEVLNEILVQSQGLTGTWEDIAFAGGTFIGLLGEIDAQGNVVKQGFIEKFVQPFMELPKAIRDVEIAQAIGKIFPENAARGFIPLVQRYAEGLDALKAGGAGASNELLKMYAQFQNGDVQAELFKRQWETVSNSLKVRFDQAVFGIKEAAIRLGLIVGEALLPIAELASAAALKFAEFAEANPRLTTTILGVVGALAVLAGTIGPLLMALGFITQGIAGLAVAKAALAGAAGIVTTALASIAPVVLGVGAVLFGVVLAVRQASSEFSAGWQAMAQAAQDAWVVIQNAGGSLLDTLTGLMLALEGLLSGNVETIRAGLQQAAIGIIETFVSIPQQVLGILADFGQQFYALAEAQFGGMSGAMETWGWNLMMALGDGIVAAASYVYDAVTGIADGIASFFRSYSPPRFGPLKGIYVWGRNLITTFIEGMQTADIDAVSAIAGRIGDALDVNKEFGELQVGVDFRAAFLEGNALAAEMVGIIQDGGRVSADFFSSLQEGLGDWYEDVVGILLAYQEVYAAERGLKLEQDKLKLIQEQRKELERQAQLRQRAFDRYLTSSDGSSFENNQQYLVDPESDEGKAQIEAMRQSLSLEDFQTWITFQKRLWEQKTAAEDEAMQVQEDAAQLAVNAYQQQLELVKAQYEYLVKMYDYAKGLLESEAQAEGGRSGGGGGGGGRGATRGTIGNPEDLEEARRRIRELVGDDQAIYDEQQLSEQRGGDDIGALDDASGQQQRERDRIAELDAENRRRRAQFETDLINANSEEERKRLREQMDAWDAAYKEEKARLQERRALTEEIADASDQRAELTSSQRIQEQRAVAEEEIAAALEGQLDTQGSLKDEEKELQDLRNVGDRKRLEFQERLRQAEGDPAAIRRIKEEQAAWEEAYKAALQAQEERVQALRETEQAAKTPAAGGRAPAGGGYGVPDASDFPTPGGGTPTRDEPTPEGSPAPAAAPSPAAALAEQRQQEREGFGDGAQRDTQQDAAGKYRSLIDTLRLLADTSVDTRTKFAAIGEAVAPAFAPFEGAIPSLRARFGELSSAASDMRARIQESGAVDAVIGAWGSLGEALTGAGGVFAALGGHFAAVAAHLTQNHYAVGVLTGIWANTLKPALELVWNFITTGIMPVFAELSGILLNVFAVSVDAVASFLKLILVPAFRTVSDIMNTVFLPIILWTVDFFNGAFSLAIAALAAVWETKLRPAIEVVITVIRDILLPLFALLVESGLLVVQLAVEGLKAAWDLLKPAIMFVVDAINEHVVPVFKLLYEDLLLSLKSAIDDAAAGWDSFKAAVERVTKPIGDFITKTTEAIRKLREFLSMGGTSADTSVPDGSHAKGLARVPFDGYIAELHANERVLTAQEAARYNAMERTGILDNLGALVQRATGAMAQATAAASAASRPSPAMSTTVNEGSSTRMTNITIGSVEIADEGAGKAFLQRLAFLG